MELQGGGKSHLALRLADNDESKVFGTDDWFESQPGGYRLNWSIKNLGPAHRWNQERVKYAAERGVNPIVVDNTNLSMFDAKPYIEIAKSHGYTVEIRESDSPWWKEIANLLKKKGTNKEMLAQWAEKLSNGFEHEGKTIKNQHGVPKDTILKMFDKYHPYTMKDFG